MATVAQIRKKRNLPEKAEAAKQTPEQQKQAESEGQAFIQQREQRTSQLEASGASKRFAEVQAAKELTARAESTPEAQLSQQLEAEDLRANIKAERTMALLQTLPEAQKFKAPTQQEIQQFQPTEEQKKRPLKEAVAEKGILGATRELAEQKLDLRKATPLFLSTVAETVDSLKSIASLSGRNPKKLQNTQEAVSNSMALLQNDVELVKLGLKSPDEAKADFNSVQSAINEVEGAQQGIGKLNVNYWILHGKEIEEYIKRSQNQLQDIGNQLEIASTEALLNQARLNA